MKGKGTLSTYPIIFVLLLLVSCGGGGGGGDAGDKSPSSNNPPGGAINAGIEGKIVLGDEGWVLDLSTGNYTQVAGVEEWDENPEYLGVAIVTITSVAFSGSRTVETVYNCEHGDTILSNHTECVRLHGKTGDYISGLLFKNGDLLRPAKLSRDLRYLAVIREYDSSNNIYLEIHDTTDNSLINYSVISSSYASVSFDWLPGNRIVYTLDQDIYLTSELSTFGNSIAQFDASEGKPIQITASPSGEYISFVLETSANPAAVHGYAYTMDINGNNLTRLAYVPGESEPRINYPTWSPDGNWIAVVEGDVSGSSSSAPGYPGVLYAVPAMAENTPLTLEASQTEAIPIQSRFNQVLTGSGDLSYRFIRSGELFWLE
jgi:hypothetical protein